MIDARLTSAIGSAPELSEQRRLLAAYRACVDTALPGEFWDGVSVVKQDAVSRGDQLLATACWCFQTIGGAQEAFVSGFGAGKREDYYSFWCQLEQAQLQVRSLRRHVAISDDFGLCHIATHVQRFQELFPYKFFLSPGMIVSDSDCSICQQPIQLRGGCEHVIGDIYDGEQCVRVIKTARILEVSIVDAPVQKATVIFGPEISYDYGAVRYVVAGLTSPWHAWSYEREMIVESGERYPGTSRNHLCPCGSMKKYKRCCQILEKKRLHYQVHFDVSPPPELPPFVRDAGHVVTGSPLPAE